MRHRILIVIAIGLLAPALLSGQQTSTEHAPPEHPAHKDLRALRDELVDAFNKNDFDRLLRHVTEDAVLTWQDAEVSRGHKGIRDYYNRMMVGDNRVVQGVTASAEVDELTRLYGQDKDSGLAFGRLEQDFQLTNGLAFHLANRWTAHVVKDGGRWKVSAFHVSANLFDNPVQATILKRTALTTGAVALGLGLVVGVLLARAFRRPARGPA